MVLPSVGGGGRQASRLGVKSEAPRDNLAVNSYVDIDSDEVVAADSVRQFGNQSVYARKRLGRNEQILVTPETAELDLDKDREKIETIERFSEAYFAIVAANTPIENQILSQQSAEQQLLIKLRGKTYLVK